MTIWCGQCQTPNEGDAERCTGCGALLTSHVRRPTSERAGIARSQAEFSSPALDTVRAFDPSLLVALLDDQLPDRFDLRALAAGCRLVLGVEQISPVGLRLRFLANRPGFDAAPSGDRPVLSLPHHSVTLDIVQNAAEPRLRAVAGLEVVPQPAVAAPASDAAHRRRLASEVRGAERKIWLIPVLVCLLSLLLAMLVLPALTSAGPGSPGKMPAQLAVFLGLILEAYLAVYVYHLIAAAGERSRRLALLEDGFAAQAPGAILALLGAAGHRDAFFNWTHVPRAAMTTLSLLQLWLAARSAFPPIDSMPPWEPAVAFAIAALMFPAWTLLRYRHRRNVLAQARRDLAANRPSASELWLAM